MSWKLFATTFSAIFLAELGDKTQLAAFALASGSESRWTVFLAGSLALIATTGLAVLAGGWIGKHVPTIWLQRVAGVMFIVLGVLFLFARGEPPPSGESGTPGTPATSEHQLTE